jgi:hypothetical protein
MGRTNELALIGTSAILCACCGTHPRAPAPSPHTATVRVVNKSRSLASVWAAGETEHMRLGNAEAKRTVELVVPPRFLGARDSVRFLAFAAGSSCVHQVRLPMTEDLRFTLVLRPGEYADTAHQTTCRWR